MKNAKIFINNSIIDSEEAFGVFFTDASITALMTPSPLNATLDKCSVSTRAKSKKHSQTTTHILFPAAKTAN